MNNKTKPLHVLSKRGLLQIKTHIETESTGIEKDMLQK